MIVSSMVPIFQDETSLVKNTKMAKNVLEKKEEEKQKQILYENGFLIFE